MAPRSARVAPLRGLMRPLLPPRGGRVRSMRRILDVDFTGSRGGAMAASTRNLVAAGLLMAAVPAVAAPTRPNIVIMYADNLGYGEVGIYGGVRGVSTPRLDALAREGLRLTNFNVETFCTPSRTALLTGRYGIRSGTLLYRAPVKGMTLWEITISELLKPLGSGTAL